MTLFTNVVVIIVAFVVVGVGGDAGGYGSGSGSSSFLTGQHSPFQLVYMSIAQNALRCATVTNVQYLSQPSPSRLSFRY